MLTINVMLDTSVVLVLPDPNQPMVSQVMNALPVDIVLRVQLKKFLAQQANLMQFFTQQVMQIVLIVGLVTIVQVHHLLGHLMSAQKLIIVLREQRTLLISLNLVSMPHLSHLSHLIVLVVLTQQLLLLIA